MGPRAPDRGRIATRSRASRRRGFNGAAIVGPRKGGSGSRRGAVDSRASMGPRSSDRGRVAVPAFLVVPFLASMGPRSLDRGWPGGVRHDGDGHDASMGPRSSDRGRRLPHPGLVAHVVASMGPRSSDRGRCTARTPSHASTHITCGDSLAIARVAPCEQRRRLAAAVLHAAPALPRKDALLACRRGHQVTSMGPRASERGMALSCSSASKKAGLQWGRSR